GFACGSINRKLLSWSVRANADVAAGHGHHRGRRIEYEVEETESVLVHIGVGVQSDQKLYGAVSAVIEERIISRSVSSAIDKDLRVLRRDVKLLRRAGRADTDVSGCRDIDRAGWCAWPDAERQTCTTRHVTNEEVGFVRADVPRLRREATGIVLFEANRGRVSGVCVDVQHWCCGADSDVATAADAQ